MLALLLSMFALAQAARWTTLDVTQADFAAGSLVLEEPRTRVVFQESVAFEPEVASTSPLGYFAAIVIATDHVEIDLNGFELSMGKDFYLEQRFFALIEVGSKPFVEGQGPADFGSFVPARHVEIHNGRLGLSSHHGVHGSIVDHVKVHDLEIMDFEVAGLHFNGAHHLQITNVDIGPSASEVPVNGLFSNAWFLRPLLEEAAMTSPGFAVDFGPAGTKTLTGLLSDLDAELALRETSPLFSNPSGRPDGSALYGIIVHRVGVAIGPLGSGTDLNDDEDVKLKNVRIEGLDLTMREWGALTGQVGPFGDLLDFSIVVDENGRFNGGNVVFRAQVALGHYKDQNDPFIGHTLWVGSDVVDWVASSEKLQDQPWYLPWCDVDVMGHSIKGVCGLRVEFVEKMKASNVVVAGLDQSLDRSDFCPSGLPPTDPFGLIVSHQKRGSLTHVRSEGHCWVTECQSMKGKDVTVCDQTFPHFKLKREDFQC